MATKFRKLSLTCLLVAVVKLITGKLRLSNIYMDQIIEIDDNSKFQIFRHITAKKINFNSKHTIFIVSFKFSHLSHKANKLASIIPMLMIAGFPGFVKKIYAVNHQNGYWQGMYQWKSSAYLEAYKKSFIFKVMNKRAIPETIKSIQYENTSLDHFIQQHIRNK